MCISLLQDFVLQALLDFFRDGKENPLFDSDSFSFNIRKVDKVCTLESSRFQPFLVTVTKGLDSASSSDMILQVNNHSETFKGTDDLKEKIKVL